MERWLGSLLERCWLGGAGWEVLVVGEVIGEFVGEFVGAVLVVGAFRSVIPLMGTLWSQGVVLKKKITMYNQE